MAISNKTRKLLWGRSGSRCAHCRQELVIDTTQHDSEAIVGDECHIVAKEAAGPRGDPSFPKAKLDEYENLILLCKIHHKMVDDQPNTYTVDRLRKLKADHESWVQSRLDVGNKEATRQETKIVKLRRIRRGETITDLVSGSHMLKFDNEPIEQIQEVEIVGNFVDTVNVLHELEGSEMIRAGFDLSQQIDQLESVGFYVYGRKIKGKYHVTFQSKEHVMEDWYCVCIFLSRKEQPDITIAYKF